MFFFSYFKPKVDNDASWGWPIWTPGAWLAGFLKGITKHCYTQNIKALGHMVSEEDFLCFPIVSQWELSVAMKIRVLIKSGPKTLPPE